MAKGKADKGSDKDNNGAIVFEKMGKGFVIPPRRHIEGTLYKETVEKLKGTSEVVAIYHGGEDAKTANVRRKSLMAAAKAAGVFVRATVRAVKLADGSTDNVLLAQMGTEDDRAAYLEQLANRKPRSPNKPK